MNKVGKYTEKYGGIALGLFIGLYFYSQNIIFWGNNDILVFKSMDIGFILFGFFLTVLALIVQGDNASLRRLKQYQGYSRIIKFSRRVVFLSAIIWFYSLAIASQLNEKIPLYIDNVFFSFFAFLWIWLLFDSIIFLIIFYNIILQSSKES